jgi:hypothetical protein
VTRWGRKSKHARPLSFFLRERPSGFSDHRFSAIERPVRCARSVMITRRTSSQSFTVTGEYSPAPTDSDGSCVVSEQRSVISGPEDERF